MSVSTSSAGMAKIASVGRKRSVMRCVARLTVWLLGIPALLSLIVYCVLLVTPIRMPFAGDAIRALIQSTLPPSTQINLGHMALALENRVWPVIRFSPVSWDDSKTGAHVMVEALEVGFSPVRALFGQPGVTITVLRPRIQIVQDLYGPRLTSFAFDDTDGNVPIVRVQEGEDRFPMMDISSGGVGTINAEQRLAMRSDNDWLVYNLEASEQGIANIVDQATQGRFSHLVVRDGTVDMIDAVYGLYRRFEAVNFEIDPPVDRRDTRGKFSAMLADRVLTGTLARTIGEDGAVHLEVDVTNLDFSAILPFIDDNDSLVALRGAGALSVAVNFIEAGGKLKDGWFKIDLTGMDVRLKNGIYPVITSIFTVDWKPDKGQFGLAEGELHIGNSSASVSGTFALGLDPKYGPTMGMALMARNVVIHPHDMEAPAEPFDSVEFSGWSAPLYGALGIDNMVLRKGDGFVAASGRIDVLQAGMGVDLAMAGQGMSADDVKRLWPYMMGTEGRDWFVANITDGMVTDGQLKFNFPVGSLQLDGKDRPLPKEAIRIDMTGTGVAVKPLPDMEPITIDGQTRLQLANSNLSVSATGGKIATTSGDVAVANPTVVMDNSNPHDRVIEVSGDLSAPIPAILALVNAYQPQILNGVELPIDLNAITGSVDLGMVATIGLVDEQVGESMSLGYVVNGTVADFSSSEPIQGRRIGNGQLAFNAWQDGYWFGGTAEIDGMPMEVEIGGTPTSEPALRIISTISVADLGKIGFDLSQFASGQVRFAAQPMPDGSIRMAVDLQDAALTLDDLGLAKVVGASGAVTAVVRQKGTVIELSQIDFGFGSLRMQGDVTYDAKKGLETASFSHFALSAGDNAQLVLTSDSDGYSVQIRGQQLDLRPMLQRFFGLGQGYGGVLSSQLDQTISLDVKLDRVLGYYGTTAFNVSLGATLHASQVSEAALTAQFAEGNGISVTTNPASDGRTLSVAFNDAGTILRLLGVYSQLAGGAGNLVLTTDRGRDVEFGQLVMRGFSIVDEANVAQILGNHADSHTAIARQNRVDFDVVQVDFRRHLDRVEVTNAMLTGPSVGGTLRGFIYTGQSQYDLSGTYVPLFGLNNAFQKIPLLGPLLGGRQGEGLFGVTFAIQGPLDNPQFRINPLSALVPGAFRELFEFRSRELPRIE